MSKLIKFAFIVLFASSIGIIRTYADNISDETSYKRNIVTPQDYSLLSRSESDWLTEGSRMECSVVVGSGQDENYGAPYYNYAINSHVKEGSFFSAYKPVNYIQTVGSGYADEKMTERGYNVEFDFRLRANDDGKYDNYTANAQLVVATQGLDISPNAVYSGDNYIFSLSQNHIKKYTSRDYWHVNDLNNDNDSIKLEKTEWFHLKLVVTSSSSSYTITRGSTKDIIDKGELKLNGLPTITSIWCGLASLNTLCFDNFEVYDYVTGRQPDEPTITLNETKPRNWTYTISFSKDKGDVLYYELPGETEFTKYTGDDSSIKVIVDQDGTLSAYTVYGTSRSKYASQIIQLEPETLEINESSSLASFSSSYPVRVPDDTYIYYANLQTAINTSDLSTITISLVPSKVIPANQGVFVYKEGGGNIELDYDNVGDANASLLANNAFKGTCSGTYTVKEGDMIYALFKYRPEILQVYQGVVIGPHKAYADLKELGLTNSKLDIVFDGEATGIRTINQDNESLNSEVIYNLKGQRVGKSYKGIVIINGEKYLNK